MADMVSEFGTFTGHYKLTRRKGTKWRTGGSTQVSKKREEAFGAFTARNPWAS